MFIENSLFGDFPGGPVAKIPRCQFGGLGSVPDQGAGSDMPQLRPKTPHSQTDEQIY